MGADYSHAHAACLASQLPQGSRVLSREDPEGRWDDATSTLWHIERELNALRWALGARFGKNEPPPSALPYPGEQRDRAVAAVVREANRRKVDEAFGMNGDDAYGD